MPQAPTTHSAIDFAIDRRQLQLIKKRFLNINEQRWGRAHEALSERQQLLLELLPLLLHVNHPVLPGYVSADTPAGLCGFEPSKAQLKNAKRLARSFRFQPLNNRQRNLQALFLMGSVGTIGHSQSSDLDFWLCFDPSLSAAQQHALRQKCDKLSQWGQSLGLDVVFFCMNAERFSRGETLPLSDDSSGRAQHHLLLDEFYRSAIYLAGRMPLWWFVPCEHDAHYEAFTAQLLGKRFLRSTEVIDLGGLPCIPLEEFVSAGIWQLYKGIASPYKSILKLLLLETYASHHPRGQLLSQRFKQAVHLNQLDIDTLDPYKMVYQVLEEHLLKGNQKQRLELVRRCFYFKVSKPLTAAKSSHSCWQRNDLEKIVSAWQWSREQLEFVDRRRHWKVLQVQAERQLLVSELLNCYRFLADFSRQATPSQSASASPGQIAQLQTELTILGRKLHAAFERKAGKVSLINPGISPDISEPYLHICRSQGENRPSQWQLMARAPQQQFDPRSVIKSNQSLALLFTWSYINHLWTPQTRAHLTDLEEQTLPLSTLFKAFQTWLPLPQPTPPHRIFSSKSYPQRLLLLANLSQPAQPLAAERQAAAQTDVLNYRPNSSESDTLCLLKDLHLICHNSWHEVLAHTFEADSLASLVNEYLRLIQASERPPPSVEIYCRESDYSRLITQRLERLFEQLQQCFNTDSQNHSNRFVLCTAGQYFCWQRLNQQISLTRCDSIDDLCVQLGVAQGEYSPIYLESECLQGHPLRAACEQLTGQAIRVYYLVCGEHVEVYSFDEKGSLCFARMPFRDSQSLLQPLHRYLRTSIDRLCLTDEMGGVSFGVYPVEFFELCAQAQGGYTSERRHATTELNALSFFNVQAIAHLDSAGEVIFSIYCDQQEFHASQLGDKLYKRVASYILARRKKAERYPCYITDLDLSHCEPQISQGQNLQISHYLRIKSQLEQQLNIELQNI